MGDVILVAGGAGFIGSHLCATLLEQGNKIICIDNLSTGRKTNISDLLKNKKFKFIKADISLKTPKFDRIKIDKIYHLASPASVDYITQFPTKAAFANSLGTKNLLGLAREKKSKILFASSSEVYGDPKVNPQKEDYWGNVNPVGVRSSYDEGKRFGEALCMAYKREFGIDTKIIRIFNTYGPNSSIEDSRVIPSFIVKALLNKPITVHGKGTQTRSFCYVSDLVDGMIKIMDSSHSGPFNIGNPDEYKIIDVANKIIKLTKSKSKIKLVARPEDDPSVRKPDISKAKKLLGFKPKIGFEEGLLSTIRYFESIV